MPRRLLSAILTMAIIAVACGRDDGEGREVGELTVVATTSIVADVAGRIVAGLGTVEVLMASSADPHSFRPSARQLASLHDADLVIANGLGLEEGLVDVLAAAEGDGVEVLGLAELLNPIPFGSPAGDHPDSGEGSREGDLDPHFWLDPLRMADAVVIIGDALAGLDPRNEGWWRRSAAEYRDEVLRVHDQIEGLLATIPESRRKLITGHDALGYFASRYGFQILGTVIPSGTTLAAPSASDLAELVEQIESEGVGAIFTETTGADAFADALASETDREVAVVELYTGSLGEPGSGAATYLDMLLHNARLIATALG